MKKTVSILLICLMILCGLPGEINGLENKALAAEATIVKIVADPMGSKSVVLMSNGNLYGWGDNSFGLFANGNVGGYFNTPQYIGTGFTDIALGEFHTLALKGTDLYAWGYNEYGQLGLGNFDYSHYTPQYVGTGFTQIAAGEYFSLALKGLDLYSWGYGWNGRLGISLSSDRVNTPQYVGTGFTQIVAGYRHCLALKGNDLYAWGYNEGGQIGNGNKYTQDTPLYIGTGYTQIATAYESSFALKGTDLFAWGSGPLGMPSAATIPTQVGTGFTCVATGYRHTLALKGTDLYAWGGNAEGQLGNNTLVSTSSPQYIGSGFTQISAGIYYSVALKGQDIYTWGRNGDGALGDGTNENKHVPTKIAFNPSSASYAVNVINGSGSGTYSVGSAVTITANAASSGYRFDCWNISRVVDFAEGNERESKAKFTMPAEAVTVEAKYVPSKVNPAIDRWGFRNQAAFIEKEHYQAIHGTLRGSIIWALNDYGDTSGLCYGFVATAASISMGKPNVSSFYGKTRLIDVGLSDSSSVLNMSAMSFIKEGYVYQQVGSISDEHDRNKNKYKALVSAVKAYENGTGYPVVIIPNNAHAVLGVGIERDNATQCDILLYESNTAVGDPKRVLRLNKDSGGNFTSWSYGDYSSNRSGGLSYNTPVDEDGLFEKVRGARSRASTEDDDRLLLYTGVDNFTVGNSASSLNVTKDSYDMGWLVPILSVEGEETAQPRAYWADTQSPLTFSNSGATTIGVAGYYGGIEAGIPANSTAVLDVVQSGGRVAELTTPQNGVFTLTYLSENSAGNDINRITLSGKSSGMVKTKNTQDGIILTGANTLTINTEIDGKTASKELDNPANLGELSISVNGNNEIVVKSSILQSEIEVTASGLDNLKVGQSVTGSIFYTLSNGTYANPITATDFTITGLPDGLIAGQPVRTSDTAVTVPITGKPTTASESTTMLTYAASIPAANISNASEPLKPTGSISASKIAKGNGAAVSGRPTVNGMPSASAITINAVTNTSETGQSVEYSISTNYSTVPATGWQDGTTFSGLAPNTVYYVFVRAKGNANYDVGTALVSAAIMTAAADGGSSGSGLFSPMISSNPAALTNIVEGETVTLSVVATWASGPMSYQWYRNSTASNVGGTPIDGATGVNYAIPGNLSADTYYFYCMISAAGASTAVSEVATVIVNSAPTSIAGDNQLTVLPGSSFALAFVVEVNGNTEKTTMLTINVGNQTTSVYHTGNGTCIIPCEASFNVPGSYPVTVSADGIAVTNVGTVTVVDVRKYLKGSLNTGNGYLYGQASLNIPVAFKSASGMLDSASGILTLQGKDALTVGIRYTGSGNLTGRLVKMRTNPFAASSKALQNVPDSAALKVTGKRNTGKKYATFTFSARSMYRLEPGFYQFEVQSAKNGKYKGFPYLTLATIHVTESQTETVTWAMPLTLRASAGRQYNLVTLISDGGTLPPLTVSSSNKKIASIDSTGVLTAKKPGTVTIKVRAASGSVMKCAVTVVSNSFSHARPLMISKKAGLYSSTKRLYYKNNALNVEIFLYNRTGMAIKGLKDVTFELYDGEALIFRRTMQPISFEAALKNKQYKTLAFIITDALLPGIAVQALDLGSGRHTAVVRGIDSNGRLTLIQKSGVIGTVMTKSNEGKPAGSMRLQIAE